MAEPESWRLLPYDVGSSRRHVALGDALARLVRRPTIWWHATDQPTLVLGAGQTLREVDLPACQAAGVLIVKRQAGGTSVYAASGVLGLDVALPASHALITSDVLEAYRWIGHVWADALRQVGVTCRVVEIAEARAAPRGPSGVQRSVQLACFGSLSPYEVVVGSRKLVGLAQVRRRAGTLVQCGIYAHFDADRLSTLLAVADRSAVVAALQDAAVGLDQVAPPGTTLDEVRNAWEASLSRVHGVRLQPGDWSDEELVHASEVERSESSSNG